MMRYGIFICLFVSSLYAQTNVVLMGGGDYFQPTIRRFSELAGKTGTVLVIPWASDSGHEAYTSFRSAVDSYMGANAPRVVEASFIPKPRQREEFPEDEVLKAIAGATGIFFTGGDQGVLIEKLQTNPKWIPALKKKFLSGTVFGGSSAGTALMAENMPTGVGDETVIDSKAIETRKGLGLVSGVLVDQHFIIRQRQNRLFSLLLRGPECFGLGVDQDNGVHVMNDETVEVLGPGLVMTIDKCNKAEEFVVKLHKPGEMFFLKR